MTLTEIRLLIFLVKMIDPINGTPDAEYDIHVLDFARFYKLSRKDLYTFIDQLTDDLFRQRFKISHEQGFTKHAWITDATYVEGQGILRLKLHDKFEKYVMSLSRDFTQVPAEDFQGLKSKFSIWFLLLAAKGLKLGKREYERMKLQGMVGAQHYENYSDFRRRVLEPAEKELRAKSSFYFHWEVGQKRGRSPLTLDLFFHRNKLVLEERKKLKSERPPLGLPTAMAPGFVRKLLDA